MFNRSRNFEQGGRRKRRAVPLPAALMEPGSLNQGERLHEVDNEAGHCCDQSSPCLHAYHLLRLEVEVL
jgi:hypothetical protein